MLSTVIWAEFPIYIRFFAVVILYCFHRQSYWEVFFLGANYECGLYNQLMEVMECLDSVEKESKKEIRKLNDEISP